MLGGMVGDEVALAVLLLLLLVAAAELLLGAVMLRRFAGLTLLVFAAKLEEADELELELLLEPMGGDPELALRPITEIDAFRWRSRYSSLEISQDPFCPAFLRMERQQSMPFWTQREHGESPSQPRLDQAARAGVTKKCVIVNTGPKKHVR